jgi:hypothetical protein
MERMIALTLAAGSAALLATGAAIGSTGESSGTRAPTTQTAPAASTQKASVKQPVVVELFTSQGCSSCPPADKVAARLTKDPNLVVLSRPVTYWDRLGWKDTLARTENTNLQRAYARRGIAGRNGVYTPQIVVDGQRGTVGSRLTTVRQYIRQEAGAPAAIAMRTKADGSLLVGIAGQSKAEAELVLVAIDKSETVRIGRGENGGREVTYTNVVLGETVLTDWNSGVETLTIAPNKLNQKGANAYALLLREKNAGPILAGRTVTRS